MDIFLSILAYILALVGLVGCIIPALPGTALSYVSLLIVSATSFSQISSTTLWIWLFISAVVIAVDYVFPALMTKVFGGSRQGAIGATVGIFVGLLMGPWGIILGPFFGAILGELLHDKTQPDKALKVGFGSFLSFIVGTGIKLVASIYMLILMVEDSLPPMKEWFASIF